MKKINLIGLIYELSLAFIAIVCIVIAGIYCDAPLIWASVLVFIALMLMAGWCLAGYLGNKNSYPKWLWQVVCKDWIWNRFCIGLARNSKKNLSKIYLVLIFGILYIPILTLIFFSFNSENSTAVFGQFSFRWYKELFNSPETFAALRNTLILAISSASIATVIGTAAAEGIYKMKSKLLKSTINSITNIPMMNPDIVTAMSMMLFFVVVAGILRVSYDDMGFFAMLIAHITFCLPYVILSVLPRITEFGDSLSEAALDLGCTPMQAFFKVKLPNIMHGVVSGFVMAFTLSLDDFVISYFVGSSKFQTLPLLIYSMTKKKVTPDMYALSTLIIIAIFALLLFSNIRSGKEEERRRRMRKGAKK